MKKKKENKFFSCQFVFETKEDRRLFLSEVRDAISDNENFNEMNIRFNTEDFLLDEEDNSDIENENFYCCGDCSKCSISDDSDEIDPVKDETITALHDSNGNVAQAARSLCISKSQVYRRIKKYDISQEDWDYSDDIYDGLDNEDATKLALKTNSWDVSLAADALGVSKSTIYRRIKKYGITLD